MTNPHPEEKRTMNILGRFKAHGLAVEAMGGVRQCKVQVQFADDALFADGFRCCMGPCPKCDQMWGELRASLRRLEVVEIDPREATAPGETDRLPDRT